MAAKVYYVSARSARFNYQDSLVGKFVKAAGALLTGKQFGKDEVVPIKIHFGNEGVHRTIRPIFVKTAADALKRLGAKPYLTDSARVRAYEYLGIANECGYNYSTLGIPVICADGIYGQDSIRVRGRKYLKNAFVASAIHDAKSMLVMSHVKGHIQAGLGGALKNLAMGGVSAVPRGGQWKEGRGAMHFLHGDTMKWNAQLCDLCMDCFKACPVKAISFKQKKYRVSDKLCWRCGRCARICPREAISVPVSSQRFFEAMLEGAAVVLSTFKRGRVFYINLLLEMQPECDCMPISDTPVAQDWGIMFSDDPVAIDAATLDVLANVPGLPGSRAENLARKAGEDIFTAIHRKESRLQIEYGEKLGLGKSSYVLVEYK